MLIVILMSLYQQFMIKLFIVLIVNAFLLLPIAADQPTYQLSPILPPSAFMGQLYSCKFQVAGLKLPKFDFEGLPKEFTSNASGLVTGVPLKVGSYLVTVTYSSNSFSQSQQTIIRVTTSDQYPVSSLYPAFSISASISTFVFMAGTSVNISFTASMGSPPYQWAYLRLPLELSGTKDGQVTGYFEMEGYYSFGVTCSDSLGKSTDSFFTLNIQPFTFFNNWAPQALRPIVDVSNKDYYSQAARQMIWQSNDQTQKELATAAQKASKAHSTLNDAQRNMVKANYTLLLANQYVSSSENQLADARNKKSQAQKYLNKATLDMQSVDQALHEKEYSFQQACESTIRANETLLKIQIDFDRLTEVFQNASTQLINAQDSLANASSTCQQAQMAYSEAHTSSNLSLSTQTLTQKQYDDFLSTYLKTTDDVESAQREVNGSKEVDNFASQELANRIEQANAAVSALKDANEQVSSLKAEAGKALDALGQAKFNLTMAQNQLYIAQAIKAQAIKALYLISSQAPSASCPSTFAGCDPFSYPSSFGTAQVKQVTSSGILLETGQNLLLGNCTASVAFAIGDLITFQGYLKDGCVHLLSFTQSQSI